MTFTNFAKDVSGYSLFNRLQSSRDFAGVNIQIVCASVFYPLVSIDIKFLFESNTICLSKWIVPITDAIKLEFD